MTTQVLIVLTTMNTSLSTQFTQCLGSQTLGQEMVQNNEFGDFIHTHTHTHVICDVSCYEQIPPTFNLSYIKPAKSVHCWE